MNISHIDSDSEEEPEQEEVKVSVMESPVKPGTNNIKIEDESSPPIKSGIAKRMVISKFYPPSNRQESISIDEIEDSSVLKENTAPRARGGVHTKMETQFNEWQ